MATEGNAPEIKFRRDSGVDKNEISRRKVLGFFGWGAFWATMAGTLAGTGRFMFPAVTYEKSPVFKAGSPKDYPPGVSTRFLNEQQTWIINDNGIIYALISICTHLGCTPDWLANENKFKCNCHGSGYYVSGVNYEGPAPRAMDRAAISVGDDGQLLIDKSKKFAFEKGEWEKSEAFIKAT
ncbi:MAG: Rieske 2Fe-2S domain-containing protein [Cyanobacteriota bacterium]